MSDLSAAVRTRLITAFGTVIYFDTASGKLRHGPVESSPANAMFVADPDRAPSHRSGWLMHDSGATQKLLLCGPDHCEAIPSTKRKSPSASATRLKLISLERGLISFEAGGLFLSAFPDGSVKLCAPACSTWELFLGSEDWCADATNESPVAEIGSANIDWKKVRSYIVHPLIRKKASASSNRTKVLIYGYPQWSHGRVYYDLCKHLHRRGYIVDILNWQDNHASYIGELIPFYDLFMTALDGVRTLVDVYGVPYDRIIAISHHEFDIRMLIEQKGADVFDKFANYGVVSEFLYSRSLMGGVPRAPAVVPLGINFSEFYAAIPERLETVGYASSMSAKTYGVEWKRGELSEAAAREAGLAFKVAGSTGNQITFHDMPEFYRSVDAVVTSSISEAAQLPVMEAAAAGRLVIGTPVGHFPQKAYQGGGIMAPIEADKFQTFTAETLRYYKDNPLSYRNKCRSIQEAAKKFDWEHAIGEWIDLIERAKSIARENSFLSAETSKNAAVLNLGNGRRDAKIFAHQSAATSVSVFNHLDLQDEFRLLKRKGLGNQTGLCRIMTSFGSDKGGRFHNYTVVYDSLLSNFRREPLSLFELGLGTNKVGAPSTMGPSGKPGASLRAWREYFPAASIYGADIDADILFQDERIKTYWVDQTNAPAISALWEKLADVSFDVIIDDGLHEAHANIGFFLESYKKLKSGGLYFIEDVTPQDADLMSSFARWIAPASRGSVCELLQLPANTVDNRLIIIQKA